MGVGDVPFDIHGFVKDAGDLHGVVAEAVEKYVLAASETPATCDEIFSGFTAAKKWIGHDAFASK
jgi:hypothetical protein